MINKQSVQSGYIMVLTLTLISLASLILAIIFQKSTIFSPFAKLSVDRQHARTLAQSGIGIAISQLAQKKEPPKEKTEDENTKKNKKDESDTKKLFTELLPVLNQWQEFRLTQEADQIDGVIKICIMSEEGKININEIFDFENKKIKGAPKKESKEIKTSEKDKKAKDKAEKGRTQKKEIDWHKPLEIIFKALEQKTGQKDLLKQIEQFLQKQEKPINDVTQLLEIKSFLFFKDHRYYQPPSQKQQDKEKERPLFLTDLFTTHSKNGAINPWLLSDSLRSVLGEPRALIGDAKERVQQTKEWLAEFKDRVSWQNDWKQQAGKMLKKISPEMQKILFPVFAESLDPTVFSVLASATINDVTQQLFVILERTKGSQNDKTLYDINIRRFYWV